MPQTHWIIGIDEVGRGSLAGPVVVCALAIPRGLSLRRIKSGELSLRGDQPKSRPSVEDPRWPRPSGQSYLPPLRDSKKLSASQRERWAAWVKTQPNIRYMIARVYPRGIERLNISQAANLAATRACMRLCGKLSLRGTKSVISSLRGDQPKQSHNNVRLLRVARNDAPSIKVLLDGGLYLRVDPRSYPRLSASTIVKGDEKFTAIKLASIVAKVTRDKFMNKLHERYPQYGFFIHKGYGTKRHIAAIKKFGPSEIHRTTFVKNFID